MTVPVLVCPCGLRMKAPGAVPGRSGRCPRCGEILKVPEPTAPAWQAGYDLGSGGTERPREREARSVPAKAPRPEAARAPSSSAFAYPFRAAEGVGMILGVGLPLWFFATLLPEYCLNLIADANKMGTPSMGYLVSLITMVPALLLVPPLLFYWLQYVGRVLVASGMGEPLPPRTPERNFDGLFNGLSPWVIWLVLGVAVPSAPFLVLAESGLGTLGLVAGIPFVFPYALMALMLSFLHDDSLAAKPPAVLGAIARIGAPFLVACLKAAGVLCLTLFALAGAFVLRAGFYYVYALLMLPCWSLAVWASIVAARGLGTCYFPRKNDLGWQVERPRWGVTWRL